MKSTGIHRKVDDLGRIVIPAGIRRSLEIREGDELEVLVEGDRVILAKPVEGCALCSGGEDLQSFNDKLLCRECVADVGALDGRLRGDTASAPVAAVPDPTPIEVWPPRTARNAFEERYQSRREAYDPASTTAW